MSLHLVPLAQAIEQPWRNGGGRTHLLLAWPRPNEWLVRVSIADIESDGPFSAFPGVQRWFQVLAGAGVRLAWPDGEDAELQPESPPRCFDGGTPPQATLSAGSTRDLNLMIAHGQGRMVRAAAPWVWPEPERPTRWRALYTEGPTTLCLGRQQVDLPAHCLAWSQSLQGPWRLQHPARAWWMALDTVADQDGDPSSSASPSAEGAP
jgi:uncharacterized protein